MKRKIWQGKWSYPEAVVIVLGLMGVGFVLQLFVGEVGAGVFSYPINILIGLVYLFVILFLYATKRQTKLVKWLVSMPFSITLMVALSLLVLMMGFTLQREAYQEPYDMVLHRLGLDRIISSWYFAFVYFMVLTVLGLVTMKRIIPFRWANFGFLLNHLGLWITLFAGVLGSGDLARLSMDVQEGKVEWRARDAYGVLYEVPIAVELHDFDMEEYPAKLYIIDARTGDALPKGKPQLLAAENTEAKATIMQWEVSVTRKLENAAPVDTVRYEDVNLPGTSQAAYITTRNQVTNETKAGWVSCGSFMYPHRALYLNDTLALVMAAPEAKRYLSSVSIYTKKGAQMDTLIEVNRPVSIAGWKIYQLSYNEGEGRWSSASTFELIRDPWISIVYFGLFMVLAGAFYMFWMANKLKRSSNDLE